MSVAMIIRSRRTVDAPTQRVFQAPVQLDRNDFESPGETAPTWLVVVFTSQTCHVCADVAAKAKVLASSEVSVHEVEFTANRRLHERYAIEAVPTTVICDEQGVVRRSFMGPVTATDLWVSVADLRDPSADREPRHCQNHG